MGIYTTFFGHASTAVENDYPDDYDEKWNQLPSERFCIHCPWKLDGEDLIPEGEIGTVDPWVIWLCEIIVDFVEPASVIIRGAIPYTTGDGYNYSGIIIIKPKPDNQYEVGYLEVDEESGDTTTSMLDLNELKGKTSKERESIYRQKFPRF